MTGENVDDFQINYRIVLYLTVKINIFAPIFINHC